METTLDRLHARARANPALARLALITRIVLAVGFIPPSLVKIQGLPFTVMGTDNPIGYFFDALHRTGGYWRFIGWAQCVAGVMLLIPRTATLGAICFLPIILNIFVITVALEFTGTPFITGPMLLAVIFLLCWDYDRLKSMIWPSQTPAPTLGLTRLEMTGYGIVTASALGLLGTTRSLVPHALVVPCLTLGAVGGLVVLASWWRMIRNPPVASRS